MSKTIENLKSGNYEVVDNQGVSVTQHFIECLEKEFADLEAKLEESEKLTERLQQIVDKLRDKEFAGKTLVEAVNAVYEPLYKNKYDEAEELKKQLQEKDEEIAYLTKQVKKFNNEAQKYFEDAYCNDFHNQDKISFAVEVLKIAQDYVQQYVNNFDDMNDCLCAIDNQIKRLTHQHEDK